VHSKNKNKKCKKVIYLYFDRDCRNHAIRSYIYITTVSQLRGRLNVFNAHFFFIHYYYYYYYYYLPQEETGNLANVCVAGCFTTAYLYIIYVYIVRVVILLLLLLQQLHSSAQLSSRATQTGIQNGNNKNWKTKE